VAYDLPGAAVRTPEGLRYRLAADTQPILQPASFRLVVAPPKGLGVALPAGWTAGRGGVATSFRFTRDADLSLDLRRRS
jgi:hypothetical protein